MKYQMKSNSKAGFSLRNYPINDDGTFDSDVEYDDDDETDCNEVAPPLQSDCRPFAEDLQTDCNEVAPPSQSDSSNIADTSQTSSVPPKPILKTPLEPLNQALVNFLANDKTFKDAVYGYFDDVEDLADYQRTAPDYLTKKLQDLQFDVNGDSLTRYYLPAARVERQKKQKAIWQKISAVLTILLLILWMTRSNRSEMAMNRVVASTESDSAIYWNKMVEYVAAYNQGSDIKIYPFSYPTLYQRINQKNIKNVEGYKQEFDFRIEEIKNSKKN